MKGKILVALLLTTVLGISCKGDQDILPESADFAFAAANGLHLPFGKYTLSAYENNRPISYNVVLEVKNEKDNDGHYIINGQSTLNFYFAKFEADFTNQSITIYGVGTTRIEGPLPEAIFEKEYLERLAKVEGYRFNVNGDKLTLSLPEDKRMIFQVDKN